MSNGITLYTPRLILRDHVIDDAATHHVLMSDDEVMYYLQDIKTHSVEESMENLYSAIKAADSEEREFYFLRIEKRDTREHVGEMGYTVMESTPWGKLVHVGYFTHKKFWGNGYATEALRELTRFAFEENDVYRITTGCIKDNGGSERVMLKNGYVKEGEFVKSEWNDDRLKDRVQYRILKPEWIKMRKDGDERVKTK